MQLTEVPEFVDWPATHYVFVEKIGPFQQSAPEAWQQVHRLTPAVLEHNQVVKYMSLYKIEPGKMTYRAGLATADKPAKLPEGFRYEVFPGGRYAKFVMNGAYSNLPGASARVYEIVEQKRLPRREGYSIEHYTNDPRKVPEAELETEILVPTM